MAEIVKILVDMGSNSCNAWGDNEVDATPAKLSAIVCGHLAFDRLSIQPPAEAAEAVTTVNDQIKIEFPGIRTHFVGTGLFRSASPELINALKSIENPVTFLVPRSEVLGEVNSAALGLHRADTTSELLGYFCVGFGSMQLAVCGSNYHTTAVLCDIGSGDFMGPERREEFQQAVEHLLIPLSRAELQDKDSFVFASGLGKMIPEGFVGHPGEALARFSNIVATSVEAVAGDTNWNEVNDFEGQAVIEALLDRRRRLRLEGNQESAELVAVEAQCKAAMDMNAGRAACIVLELLDMLAPNITIIVNQIVGGVRIGYYSAVLSHETIRYTVTATRELSLAELA